MIAAKPLGSLRRQLLRWLLVPLAPLVAVNAVFMYRNALNAADITYDRSHLVSTGALAEQASFSGGKVVVDVPYVAFDNFEEDTQGRIYYKATGIKGNFISGYDDLPPLPRNAKRSHLEEVLGVVQ